MFSMIDIQIISCSSGLEIWAKRLDRLAPLTLTSKKGNRILAHLHANIFRSITI